MCYDRSATFAFMDYSAALVCLEDIDPKLLVSLALVWQASVFTIDRPCTDWLNYLLIKRLFPDYS